MQNPELIGQGVGALFMIIAAAYAVVKGHKKSPGTPPVDRAPPPHEVRQALNSLHSQIERAAMDEQVAVQLLRAVTNLIAELEKNRSALNDNTEMSEDMRGDIRDVARDLRSLATELIRSAGSGGRR